MLFFNLQGATRFSRSGIKRIGFLNHVPVVWIELFEDVPIGLLLVFTNHEKGGGQDSEQIFYFRPGCFFTVMSVGRSVPDIKKGYDLLTISFFNNWNGAGNKCNCLRQSDDQNRDGGIFDHPFSGAADQDIGDGAVAVGAHNNQITISFPGGFNDNFGGDAVFD